MAPEQKNAFSALEQPFKDERKKSLTKLYLVWFIIISLPAFFSGFNYEFSGYRVIIIIYALLMLIVNLRSTLQDEKELIVFPTCSYQDLRLFSLKLHNINSTIENLAEKLNIKENIFFAISNHISHKTAFVTKAKDKVAIQLSADLLLSPMSEIDAIVGHEVMHVYNKDIDNLHLFYRKQAFIVPALLLHSAFIDTYNIYALTMLLISFIFLQTCEKYFFYKIKRQQEYLADIGAVKHVDDTRNYALFFKEEMLDKKYVSEREYGNIKQFFKPSTHPLPENRLKIINKAESIKNGK